MHIDLNSDLGEGCEHDAALMGLITSANISCGFHAGDLGTAHLALKSAAAQFKAEALSAKLCHLDEEFVYEIALLHRDGRFVHVVMNAATGKFIGVRHGREPISKM